jgi:magnesium-transporting ATPase (P-type)
LTRLLSVHGRYSLVRNAAMVEYSLYKNASFALVQFWYALFCGFSGQRLFDDWAMTLYNLLFTSLPPLLIAMFEKDVPEMIIERVCSINRTGG